MFTIPSVPNLKITSLGQIVSIIFKYSIPLAGILMLAMIVYGGYHMMISANNPEGFAEGKNKVLYGVLGFFLVMLTWFLIRILENVFGISILSS